MKTECRQRAQVLHGNHSNCATGCWQTQSYGIPIYALLDMCCIIIPLLFVSRFLVLAAKRIVEQDEAAVTQQGLVARQCVKMLKRLRHDNADASIRGTFVFYSKREKMRYPCVSTPN